MPTYSNSMDEEIYHGDFASPEDAAADAFYDYPDLETVWVGENKKQTAHDFVDGESILESATERAYDEAGECSEDWLADLLRDKAKCAELSKVVGDWIEANEPPKFFTVLNTMKITRAEMVAAGHLEGDNVQGDRRCAASSRSVQRAKRTGSTAGLAIDLACKWFISVSKRGLADAPRQSREHHCECQAIGEIERLDKPDGWLALEPRSEKRDEKCDDNW